MMYMLCCIYNKQKNPVFTKMHNYSHLFQNAAGDNVIPQAPIYSVFDSHQVVCFQVTKKA